jgi:hypothetical protein
VTVHVPSEKFDDRTQNLYAGASRPVDTPFSIIEKTANNDRDDAWCVKTDGTESLRVYKS